MEFGSLWSSVLLYLPFVLIAKLASCSWNLFIEMFPFMGANVYPEVSQKNNISKPKEYVFVYIYVLHYFWTTFYIFPVFFHNVYFPLKKKKEREFEKNCQIRLGTSTLNSKQILKCLLGYISSTTKNVHLWLPKPTKEWHRCFT